MGLSLTAVLGLDGSGFEAGFRRARGIAEGVSAGIKHLIIGAVGIATVEEAMRRTANTADELFLASQRLAIAPEHLQVLRQAAKNANVDFEKLVSTMERLSAAREKALIPGEEGRGARRAFGAMGVNNEMLRTMTNAQLLMGPMRNAFINFNPEQIGVVFKELGIKSFGGFTNVLRTNFEELESKMKKLGSIMDTETIVKLKILSNEFSYLASVIAARLGPAIISLVSLLIKAFAGLSATWTYIKTRFDADAMAKRMGVMPGFGGYTASQEKEIREGAMKDNPNAQDRASKAREAALEVFTKWSDFITGMEKKFKEMADELEHPKPGDFTAPTLAEKKGRKALIEPTDALVKIGNFLGGTDRTINRLAERQVYWLEKIAGNTSRGNGLGGSIQINSGYASQMGPHYPH